MTSIILVSVYWTSSHSPGVMRCLEDDHSVKWHFHHIISTWFIIVDIDPDPWAKVEFVRFLHCSVTLFSLSCHTAHFGKKSLCAAYIEGAGSYAPHPLGQNFYINYLELFCTEKCFFSFYEFIQSFLYISMNSWLFILYFA